ncbi:MAG: hypothetical protein P8J32_06865 [bacterium]|nr:hypothetical protein [bacterium]
MRKKTYRYYVNAADSASSVYHKSLGCWVFYRHRKDGKVRSRTKPLHGFDTSFKGAITQVRKMDDWRPKASGWVGGVHTVHRQQRREIDTWKGLHEHVWSSTTYTGKS